VLLLLLIGSGCNLPAENRLPYLPGCNFTVAAATSLLAAANLLVVCCSRSQLFLTEPLFFDKT